MQRIIGKTAIAAILMLVAGSFWGCAPGANEDAAPVEVARNVRVMTASPTDVMEYFEISGPLAAVRGTDISAEESGVVDRIALRKGAKVVGGEVIVELDRRLLKAEMDAAAANRELQVYNAEKTRELFEAGKVSNIERLQTDATAEQARTQSRIATLRYERAAISAPFAGLIADRYVELGQLVVPGLPIARVIDPYTLKLIGSLTENEVQWVSEGAPTEVFIEGSSETVQGLVHWVGFEADRISGKFKIEIRIDNADLRLRSGVVGRCRVHKYEHAGVMALPRDVILNTIKGPAVYIVEGDHARLRTLELGPDQGLMVVVNDGLSAGEQVVVRGHRELIDGALVKVTGQSVMVDGSIADDPAVVTDAETLRHGAGEGAR